MNFRMVLNEVCVQIPNINVFIPIIFHFYERNTYLQLHMIFSKTMLRQLKKAESSVVVAQLAVGCPF